MSSLSSNPFATRFVAPGQLDWVGPEDFFEQLMSRWHKLNYRAAIIGVHGSGKSTLLEHFIPRVGEVIFRRDAEGNSVTRGNSSDDSRHDGCFAVWLQLRAAVPQSMVIPWEELRRGRLLVLDGYEQLTRWRRATLIARTGLRGIKLLVTSHQRSLLPTLCELSITVSTIQQIVSQLMMGRGDLATISQEEIQRCLQDHTGNMREVLMDFYDRVEDRRAFDAAEIKSKL